MPSTEKDTEIRGVVVIKSKPKSKAKEKKQALALWKRVGKRTIQELRRNGGSAADVRRRYNLFRSKQPTARLRNGKVVLEWNPAPTPVYIQPPTAAPPGLKKSGINGDFNDLLSQVTSASGIDIAKPNVRDTPSKNSESTVITQNSESTQTPPSYSNLMLPTTLNHNVPLGYPSAPSLPSQTTLLVPTPSSQNTPNIYPFEMIRQEPAAYSNLAFEGDDLTKAKPDFYQGIEANLTADELKIRENTMNILNDRNSQESSMPYRGMSTLNHSQVAHSSRTDSREDDQGISVNVQTRIISTKITKVHVPRNKDQMVMRGRKDCTDSSSDNENRMGVSGKKKKGNGKSYNLPYRTKYRKRRKRNQVSFEERITLDTVPYNFPVCMETTIHKSDVNPPAPKTDQYPLFYPKTENEK